MTYEATKERWARAFLRYNGFEESNKNVVAVIAWQSTENSKPFSYNPVGSTWDSSPVKGVVTRGQFHNWRNGIVLVSSNVNTMSVYSHAVRALNDSSGTSVAVLVGLYKPNNLTQDQDGVDSPAGRNWGQRWFGTANKGGPQPDGGLVTDVPIGGTTTLLNSNIAAAPRAASESPSVNRPQTVDPGVLMTLEEVSSEEKQPGQGVSVDGDSVLGVYNRLNDALGAVSSVWNRGWNTPEVDSVIKEIQHDLNELNRECVSGKSVQDAINEASKKNPSDDNAATLSPSALAKYNDALAKAKAISDVFKRTERDPVNKPPQTNPPPTKVAVAPSDVLRVNPSVSIRQIRSRSALTPVVVGTDADGMGRVRGASDLRAKTAFVEKADFEWPTAPEQHPGPPDRTPSTTESADGKGAEKGGVSLGEAGAIILGAALVGWAALMAWLESLNAKQGGGGGRSSRGDEPGANEEEGGGGPDPFGYGRRRWGYHPEPDPDRVTSVDESVQNPALYLRRSLEAELTKFELGFADPDPDIPGVGGGKWSGRIRQATQSSGWTYGAQWKRRRGGGDVDEFGGGLDRRFSQLDAKNASHEPTPTGVGTRVDPDRPYEESSGDMLDPRNTIRTRTMIDSSVFRVRTGRIL